LKKHLSHPLFKLISESAADLNMKAFVIGGFVRDLFLERDSKDVDIVVVGSGIKLAESLQNKLQGHHKLSVFKNFGTAMLKCDDWEIEFVGARKESYRSDSRNPIVEDASLEEDISRRDFTINTLAISLNKENLGHLIDTYSGVQDIKDKTIRTPLDPDITFSDDPLRMMRAVRFATQLEFSIENKSLKAIKRNAERIKIVAKERVIDEFNKIMMAPKPSIGLKLLKTTGLLEQFFPQLNALAGVENFEGKAHKDNFIHTLKVLDNLSEGSDNLWLRWAALLHDIAKPDTKRFDNEVGWTFHGHEYLGHLMVEKIFRELKMPLNEKMKYVQKLVLLHLRPIALSETDVTDSAVRRLLFEAGDDIDDLMLLCEADITSANPLKVKKYLQNFENVRSKLKEIEEKDKIRNWQPPVSGEDIMNAFGLKPCKEVGLIKKAIREAILDGIIQNEREEALKIMYIEGEKLGLSKMNN
jgi:poly(A) polymerase